MRRLALLCLVLLADGPAPVVTTGVLGRVVLAKTGERLGPIVDVLVDPAGTPPGAVVDLGGFAGLGSRKVVVRWPDLHFGAKDQPVVAELTPDQLRDAPGYEGGSDVATPVPPAPSPDAARACAPVTTPGR